MDLHPRNGGCVHCKNDACHHKDVPKVLRLFHQTCIYVSHRHGECNLKESLFDMIKRDGTTSKPNISPNGSAGIW